LLLHLLGHALRNKNGKRRFLLFLLFWLKNLRLSLNYLLWLLILPWNLPHEERINEGDDIIAFLVRGTSKLSRFFSRIAYRTGFNLWWWFWVGVIVIVEIFLWINSVLRGGKTSATNWLTCIYRWLGCCFCLFGSPLLIHGRHLERSLDDPSRFSNVCLFVFLRAVSQVD